MPRPCSYTSETCPWPVGATRDDGCTLPPVPPCGHRADGGSQRARKDREPVPLEPPERLSDEERREHGADEKPCANDSETTTLHDFPLDGVILRKRTRRLATRIRRNPPSRWSCLRNAWTRRDSEWRGHRSRARVGGGGLRRRPRARSRPRAR